MWKYARCHPGWQVKRISWVQIWLSLKSVVLLLFKPRVKLEFRLIYFKKNLKRSWFVTIFSQHFPIRNAVLQCPLKLKLAMTGWSLKQDTSASLLIELHHIYVYWTPPVTAYALHVMTQKYLPMSSLVLAAWGVTLTDKTEGLACALHTCLISSCLVLCTTDPAWACPQWSCSWSHCMETAQALLRNQGGYDKQMTCMLGSQILTTWRTG